MSLQDKINSLRPGQEIKISGDSKNFVTVERSGDGKTLRYVRHTPNGFKMFKTEKF